ncbi:MULTISPECIES: bifunctional proline dehydrogenase/L-glutamate gamma-semialdehyde dehydrogenase [Tsukamurella]|uniref:L-glutamate gamma-semialdehyde dehydrogenase n=2 Tax=Tsukamurella TaxID=2060 RepID=A0A5C5RZK4_9ACTN|nr:MULTISPECIES: bifunctional proline dehydrogenase/L-glutamate gamma-semialdehyde dehydrogenase [Tsukamurella]NMD57892.1 bifunctional proline dehydrogenase/L-glutamate gamma-semialdehyde dehydrogenase [Tsukamurella columbiensis]TWS27878.1 aldehyde dehydrogenase family protein [Tsukamurella conjunctivitidis]
MVEPSRPSAPLPSAAPGDADVVDAAVARAQRWLRTSRGARPAEVGRREAAATSSLAALLHDPSGVAFTMGFVDEVARPEDDRVAAKALRRLVSPAAGGAPGRAFMSPVDAALLRAGTVAAGIAPSIAMPVARLRLRQLVGHLVFDADGDHLQRRLRRAREVGVRLNLNLLGEAVLGQGEADNRLARTHELLANPSVDYVSIKVSSVVAQLVPWDLEGNRDRIVERLRPLYRTARDGGKFVNLDMEEYKDLHLTIEVFTALLDEPEFRSLTAGIVLQAYLPDAMGALARLTGFARRRVAAGGAPVKVRLVKGANLAMERVDAEVHDWPLATYGSKADVDANYLRMVDTALQPENADALRIGVASQNLFSVAYAVELAAQRDVQRQLDIEMLQGMAPMEAAAVRADVGSLILYTPVVHSGDFDVAVSYLVRRLEENASSDNFLYSMFSPDPDAIAVEEERFRTAFARRTAVQDGPNRVQDRTASDAAPHDGPFTGEPDTDPSTPANRAWARAALAAPDTVEPPVRVSDPEKVDAAVATALAAQREWGSSPAAERAAVLHRVADELARRRGALLTVMSYEAGKTVAEADPEISEAVDFARYYAQSALALHDDEAVFTPHRLVVVTPPWNFPVAIPLGGVLAALAAGAAVIIKPAPQVLRCGTAAIDALHAAGVPAGLVQLVNADEADAGRRLVTHPDADAVVLTGASETAALFRGWRPELDLLAETSGKNAMVVTPAADPDLAVNDLVRSAFGHAGQKCSAASLAILVGSVGSSQRFLGQLQDAVRTLVVGEGHDLGTTVGPLIEPASGKLLRGLTEPGPGERWLVEPRRLDEAGRFWSPGVLDGVAEGSWFHTTELFGPVLGIMRAASLDEALRLQNSTGYGLTAGLHSLDPDEIAHWREKVEAGNLYINRHMTGAIVQRQSFGGWKRSSIGPGAKAGGPNYVAQFGRWADGTVPTAPEVAPTVFSERIISAARNVSEDDVRWLHAAAASDERAWATEFGVEHDPTGLASETNVFRYRPLPHLEVRVGAGARPRDLVRLQLAAARTGTRLDVTLSPAAPPMPFEAPVHTARDYADGLAGRAEPVRIRLLGDPEPEVAAAAARHGHSALRGPVLLSGRRELLSVLREQAVSTTRHRYGHLAGGTGTTAGTHTA